MDRLIRFSDYDVFAYIASGLVALALLDLALFTEFIVGAEWTVAQGFLTIFGSYVLGQLLATPAAWFLESGFVRKVLGRPSDVLMGARPAQGGRGFLAKTILGNYYTPLDSSVQARLSSIMTTQGITSAESLFWLAFPEAKFEPVTYSRMSAFLNLYGFARNISFVLILGGGALLVAGALNDPPYGNSDQRMALGAAALIAALGMIHRYLKFLRLYAVEVLTTFDALERRRV